MDFATELKNHLTKEENLLDSIIASQKQVRLFVTKRDWFGLESEMKSLGEKANEFMSLEDEKNQLIEKAKVEVETTVNTAQEPKKATRGRPKKNS